MRALALAALLVPAVPLASGPAPSSPERGCAVSVDGREGKVRTGDVEVAKGEPPRDVVAIDGAVRVRAGAVARDVVAIGGSVVVEKGAVVRGDATAVGGDVRVDDGARVEGGANAVGGRVHAASGAVVGKRSAVSVEVDGQPLAARILSELRAGLAGTRCRVEVDEDE